MNLLKKILGIVWIILGPAIIFYLLWIALREIEQKPTPDTIIQWTIFFLISIPIGVGLFLFGLFAARGEYNRLPEHSKDV